MMESFFYFAPIIVNNEMGNQLEIIGVYCTKEEFDNWRSTKSMQQDLIPRNFLEFYIKEKSTKSNINEILGNIIGNGKMPLIPTTSLIKVEDEYRLFVSATHSKKLVEEAGLVYNDFIDGYAIYLKNIVLPLEEILSMP